MTTVYDLALWIIYLFIALVTYYYSEFGKEYSAMDLMIREERAGRRDWCQGQQKERKLIEVRVKAAKPIQALPSDPIDDPQRVLGLVMLAQQIESRQLRIPDELYEIIYRYSDYNEIQTLFQMFKSPEDAMEIFGFASYEAMHRIKPTRRSKVEYLKSLRPKIQDRIYIIKIDFDQHDIYIDRVIIKFFGDHTRQGAALNWDAVAKLAHLRLLVVRGLKIDISMDDIRKAPESLEHLSIYGNRWISASGDVDLGLLPRGLKAFDADGCQGMNGVLRFHAPHSNLVELHMSDTGIHPEIDSETLIPQALKRVDVPRRTDDLIVKFLKEKGVDVRNDRR